MADGEEGKLGGSPGGMPSLKEAFDRAVRNHFLGADTHAAAG